MLQEHILYTVQEVAEWLEEQFLWALDCYRAEREENDKMTIEKMQLFKHMLFYQNVKIKMK